jgi:hypothetical protein
MTAENNSHLATVRASLGAREAELIYPCILDLIENGLDLDRFPPGAATPDRQNVTQYLAAWSRHAGLSLEESRDWLMDYCVEVLSPLSRRTPAAIRHSTKSNLKYIFNSQVPFLCECEGNRFKARCSAACPVHAEMQAKLAAKANEPPFKPTPPRPAPVLEVIIPVKEANREQFEAGLAFARRQRQKGTKIKRILEKLEARGFKTRTGRKWTYEILHSELKKAGTSKSGELRPMPVEPTANRSRESNPPLGPQLP